MTSRKIHRLIGLILILPMFGWTITGVIFFIKPGYKGAYEQLSLKTYPLETQLLVKPDKKWHEVRLIKTILGHHLLVKLNGKTEHLDPISLQAKEVISSLEYKLLIEDALSINKERYGDIISIDGTKAKTSTGVVINLDWLSLRLSQKGDDTKLINILYKIHYLQWTPFKSVNLVFGVLGLVLLVTLTILGIRLYVKNKE
ncbi:PepSY domain-containing protein [Colwellia hornerae]|uniref:PepSY domain-containing protein n=1 Tax=Colwellia hornerae TaxID=89402 RepID=A0A5C6QM04_9GAMM|nr:PepSY domain-containing protein [Colwellia hornerae]TWX53618.1 hypothetical protein ESZ28_09015 [Colwellia hornerae]TWX60269.1 hypothetical protein ESZ26_07790 [Colwellia hornerae]TWX70024.1 hypothetical protein ESZ27_04480 [Colwellia hornerae]